MNKKIILAIITLVTPIIIKPMGGQITEKELREKHKYQWRSVLPVIIHTHYTREPRLREEDTLLQTVLRDCFRTIGQNDFNDIVTQPFLNREGKIMNLPQVAEELKELEPQTYAFLEQHGVYKFLEQHGVKAPCPDDKNTSDYCTLQVCKTIKNYRKKYTDLLVGRELSKERNEIRTKVNELWRAQGQEKERLIEAASDDPTKKEKVLDS